VLHSQSVATNAGTIDFSNAAISVELLADPIFVEMRMRMTSLPSSWRCFLADSYLPFLSQTPKGATIIGLTGTRG
jgi:hypothetical protein